MSSPIRLLHALEQSSSPSCPCSKGPRCAILLKTLVRKPLSPALCLSQCYRVRLVLYLPCAISLRQVLQVHNPQRNRSWLPMPTCWRREQIRPTHISPTWMREHHRQTI